MIFKPTFIVENATYMYWSYDIKIIVYWKESSNKYSVFLVSKTYWYIFETKVHTTKSSFDKYLQLEIFLETIQFSFLKCTQVTEYVILDYETKKNKINIQQFSNDVNILHRLYFLGDINGIHLFILSWLNPHKIWIMQKHKKLVMEVNNGIKHVPQGPLWFGEHGPKHYWRPIGKGLSHCKLQGFLGKWLKVWIWMA